MWDYPEEDDDEPNVEGIALMLASHLPFDHPEACRQICEFMLGLAEASVANRQKRHAPK
jgi:hypothetical protein